MRNVSRNELRTVDGGSLQSGGNVARTYDDILSPQDFFDVVINPAAGTPGHDAWQKAVDNSATPLSIGQKIVLWSNT